MIVSAHLKKVALALPVLVLVGFTLYNSQKLSVGVERTFAVEGFDPRDLLKGHYVTFQVVWDSADNCGDVGSSRVVFCVDQKTFAADHRLISGCDLYIRGECVYGRFKSESDLEKFFIPAERGPQLDRLLRDKRASVSLVIQRSGSAQIKELFIDGKPWKDIPATSE
jgi:uncharacterized membrane-anchored protein